MNFLAHIYLSGEGDELLTIGNFIADTVRGKEYLQYPEAMQRGILLHRRIDTFTDAHAIFRKSKHRLVPTYNHYAGVLVDIYYDYFLAKHWKEYSTISLEQYAQRFYNSLQKYQHLLSEKAQNLSKYIIAEHWLEKYQTIEGIASILYQMDRRTGFISKMQYAANDLCKDESLYEKEFENFFGEIQKSI